MKRTSQNEENVLSKKGGKVERTKKVKMSEGGMRERSRPTETQTAIL